MEDGQSLGKISMVETEKEVKQAAWGMIGERPAKAIVCKEGGPVLGSESRGMGAGPQKASKRSESHGGY